SPVYPLSLHDALPILPRDDVLARILRVPLESETAEERLGPLLAIELFLPRRPELQIHLVNRRLLVLLEPDMHVVRVAEMIGKHRSEEHTSELQSRENL